MQTSKALLNHQGSGDKEDVRAGHFGLGMDGLERVSRLTAMRGVTQCRFVVTKMKACSSPILSLGAIC
jgi:hypothetical protein